MLVLSFSYLLPAPPHSSLRAALDTSRETAAAIAEAHESFATALEDQICKPLVDFKDAQVCY
jgi:hypothetical protein